MVLPQNSQVQKNPPERKVDINLNLSFCKKPRKANYEIVPKSATLKFLPPDGMNTNETEIPQQKKPE